MAQAHNISDICHPLKIVDSSNQCIDRRLIKCGSTIAHAAAEFGDIFGL